MKKIKNNAVFFTVGGAGYGAIEILWRGYTHWSMVIAGGICFMIFSRIAKKYKRHSLAFKAVLCALSVTLVEGIFGIIFNIILKKNVWDYSYMPLNIMGQVCPFFTLLWGILGFLFIPLADAMNKKLKVDI